ncbi:MAG: deoxycytidylate deaminase [Rhodobacteraceae bacterium]|nr:deoxycytidylate deaminase [Paracoccaceae bacterium]
MDDVQESLRVALQQVGYASEILHLTSILEDWEKKPVSSAKNTEYEMKISKANAFCHTAKNGAALAGVAISAIRNYRKIQHKEKLGDAAKSIAIPKQAYVIRQLKRVDEVELLRQVYGDKFIQISVSLDRESRVQNLVTKLARDNPHMRHAECEEKARHLIQVDESQESAERFLKSDEARKSFGQEVGGIFHLGDFFVDASDRNKLSEKTLHFIKAFFGENSKSPDKDEFGAFMAASAALRSVDLSRQVGAAITTRDGDIVSLGCNEVPKAGGGNYWITDDPLARDYERRAEQNSIEKQRIIVDFLEKLKISGFVDVNCEIDSPEMKAKLDEVTDDSLISDITEYGRMTHAEMTAICDAARAGRALFGTTIYVTTFPCHNCAKHIVASGIERVVFIEPYPKSKAPSSHKDSIIIDGKGSGAVCFQHFEGIAPKRYREIFSKGKRKNGNQIETWYEGEPRPRMPQRDNLHIYREPFAAHEVLKNLKRKPDL